jgi:hypothetical protein
VSDNNRRRIDQVQDASFLVGLSEMSVDELRDKRMMCNDLDVELSFYRRMLHGRMDLLAFEMRRRAGEEEQSLLEALPRILSEGAYTPNPGLPSRSVPVEAPDIERKGRRTVDKALDSDFLARLPMLSDEELGEIQRFLQEVEADVSQQRSSVHTALDTLHEELTRRYSDGTADPDDALPAE